MAPPASRRLGLAHQALALRSRYPDEPPPALHRGELRWRVRLRPMPLSTLYTVQIVVGPSRHPRVSVLDPPLQDRGAGLPHVYDTGDLCLYYDEFDPARDLIAYTVLPWTCEWLYYYELWLTTGEWFGGGIDHSPAPPDGV